MRSHACSRQRIAIFPPLIHQTWPEPFSGALYSSVPFGILTEYKEDACEHPDLDGGESLGLGRVGRDVVEDVDQHEEQCDEQRHPT